MNLSVAYVEVAASIRGYPTHHDVWTGHLSVWRHSKTNPTRRADIHSEGYSSSCNAEVPVNFIELSLVIEEHVVERILCA